MTDGPLATGMSQPTYTVPPGETVTAWIVSDLVETSFPGIAAPARGDGGARAAGAELLTPAQVAEVLGVGESDVMASLEAGDLKGKKIGTQWRVTRAAVDAFLTS